MNVLLTIATYDVSWLTISSISGPGLVITYYDSMRSQPSFAVRHKQAIANTFCPVHERFVVFVGHRS